MRENKGIMNVKADWSRQTYSKGRKSSTHKHAIKTSKHEKRRVQCRILEMHLKLRDQQLKTILYIHI